jgi:hypothetical protein
LASLPLERAIPRGQIFDTVNEIEKALKVGD